MGRALDNVLFFPFFNWGVVDLLASEVLLVVKNLPANAGDTSDVGSISGLGRSPGVGNGDQLQYSCLENSMDRGTWWTTVHGVTKVWTQLSDTARHTAQLIYDVALVDNFFLIEERLKGTLHPSSPQGLTDPTIWELENQMVLTGLSSGLQNVEGARRKHQHWWLPAVCQALYPALCLHNNLIGSTTQCDWCYASILQMRKPWVRGQRLYSRASQLTCWNELWVLSYWSPQTQWCQDRGWGAWNSMPVTTRENTASSPCPPSSLQGAPATEPTLGERRFRGRPCFCDLQPSKHWRAGQNLQGDLGSLLMAKGKESSEMEPFQD